MADYYVWSGATGAGTGASWADAYTTLTGALAGATGTGPHNIIVDSALAESVAAAAANITAATAGATINIQSVNRGGRTTGTGHDGLLSGASVSTANTYAINIANTRSQTLTISGVTFAANGGASASNNINVATTAAVDAVVEMVNCTMTINGTAAAVGVYLGPAGSASNVRAARIRMKDCTINGANRTTGSIIFLQSAEATITGLTTGYSGANKPAQLFAVTSSSDRGSYEITDSDLSGFNTSSGNLVLLTNFTHRLAFANCKLSPSVGFVTGTWFNSVGSITWVNSDSGDTKVVFRHENQLGTATHDVTYYRTNGAKMYGSGMGLKVVTSATCSESNPFVLPLFFRALSASGSSTTFAVEMLRASAVPTDRESWLEISYISDSGFPLGTAATSRNATPYTGTGANLTSSSESWAGSLSGGTACKMTVTATPSEVSLIRARISYAKPSDTVYVDPCVTISGQTDGPTINWQMAGVRNVEPAGASGYYVGSVCDMIGA